MWHTFIGACQPKEKGPIRTGGQRSGGAGNREHLGGCLLGFRCAFRSKYAIRKYLNLILTPRRRVFTPCVNSLPARQAYRRCQAGNASVKVDCFLCPHDDPYSC